MGSTPGFARPAGDTRLEHLRDISHVPEFDKLEIQQFFQVYKDLKPVLAVQVSAADGATGRCSVPSGSSTGSGEAVELRDGDPKRFGGLGVRRAVDAVNGEIAELLTSRPWSGLDDVDGALIKIDGTSNKLWLGANAILGVSVAVARTLAASAGVALWTWLRPDGVPARMPVPHFNVLNGGAHAPNDLDFQEFMIAPLGAPNITEAVRAAAEIYTMLRSLLAQRGHYTGLGDEGGFAPAITEAEEALGLLVEAIDGAGYRAGRDGVAIALDPAASGFRQVDGSFVTDPGRIRWAAQVDIGNAALIKPNQIGTMTECLDAMAAARRLGYAQMVSHRSGETCDDLIADLAVGSGCGQLKAGAPARGERVAKYNRSRAQQFAGPTGLVLACGSRRDVCPAGELSGGVRCALSVPHQHQRRHRAHPHVVQL